MKCTRVPVMFLLFSIFKVIYLAVGHAAFDLYDEVDFDSWLTSSLGQELNIKVIIWLHKVVTYFIE